MTTNKVLQEKFTLAFLHPKYWLTWLGITLMYLISWLPYRVQIAMGKLLGHLLMKIGSKRKRVAIKNIQACFPDLSKEEQDALIVANFENTGIALFEVGMGWFWPDWRVRRKFTMVGKENLTKVQAEGKGVLMLAIHMLSVEMNCRGMGLMHPVVVFYRPHNNPLMEYFQFRGRSRSNKYMLDKRDVRGLKKALKDGETCVYLPDQDYGRRRSLFVPFFNVPAATTNGTLMFAKGDHKETVIACPLRTKDGYEITISEPLDNFPSGDDEADLTRINKLIEDCILRDPKQYMWLHKRFKTRPDENAPDFYQ